MMSIRIFLKSEALCLIVISWCYGKDKRRARFRSLIHFHNTTAAVSLYAFSGPVSGGQYVDIPLPGMWVADNVDE